MLNIKDATLLFELDADDGIADHALRITFDCGGQGPLNRPCALTWDQTTGRTSHHVTCGRHREEVARHVADMASRYLLGRSRGDGTSRALY